MISNEFNLQRKKTILLYAKILHHLQENTPVAIEENNQGKSVSIYLKIAKENRQEIQRQEIQIIEDAGEGEVFSEKNDEDGDAISLLKLEEYASGGTPKPATTKKLEIFHSHFWPEAAEKFSDPNTGSKAYGALLGFNKDETSIIIDRSVHAKPTFTAFTLSSTMAERVVQHFGGIYHLYRINGFDCTEDQRILIVSKCMLSIRNPIPAQGKAHRVRCKLVVPTLPFSGTTEDSVYKYDGFIAPHKTQILDNKNNVPDNYKNLCTWLFQQRHVVGADNIADALMIVSNGIPSGSADSSVLGDMLTLNQGPLRSSESYTGKTIIYRCDQTRRVELQSDYLANTEKVFRLQGRDNTSDSWVDKMDSDYLESSAYYYFLNNNSRKLARNSEHCIESENLLEKSRDELSQQDLNAESKLLKELTSGIL